MCFKGPDIRVIKEIITVMSFDVVLPRYAIQHTHAHPPSHTYTYTYARTHILGYILRYDLCSNH